TPRPPPFPYTTLFRSCFPYCLETFSTAIIARSERLLALRSEEQKREPAPGIVPSTGDAQTSADRQRLELRLGILVAGLSMDPLRSEEHTSELQSLRHV